MTVADNGPIQEPEEPNLAALLTSREKALRDLFVNEYLADFDQTAAAVRIGYPRKDAVEFGVRLMNDQYVLQQIRIKETALASETDPEAIKKRVMAGLLREANYRGPGCSASARVAAWAKIAAIEGMDAPTRSKTELTGADGQPLGAGTFVVPGVATVEDWERMAAIQQAALTAPEKPTEPTKH